ncbi:MAG: hypothetical protein HOJ89_05180 [Opitutales bacterium]|nr:hypothetical protein [Opitutales bacterium]
MEIVSERMSGLQFQKKQFENLFQIYSKHVQKEKAGHALSYPFEVRRNGESFNAYLKGFPIPIKSVTVPDRETLKLRQLRRMESPLGQMIVKEGGLFIVRNSWGPAANPSVKGYNYMTYEYFLKYADEVIWQTD